MNLYNLKLFYDSVRLESMSAASELNHLSRPAISHAIKSLETELKVRLITHSRRTLELSEAGRYLFAEAPRLLNEVWIVENRLQTKAGIGPYKLRIGASRTLANYKLIHSIAKLKKDFAEAEVCIEMGNSSHVAKRLEDDEIDLAYIVGDEQIPQSQHYVIGKGYFELIVPKGMKKKEFAIGERRPETHRAMALYERKFGEELPIFAEVQSWDAIWMAVQNGICGGLIPDFIRKEDNHKARVEVLIPRVFPYEIKVICLKKRSQNSLINQMIQILKSNY